MSNERASVLKTGNVFYLAQLGGSLCGQKIVFADVARNFWISGATEPDGDNLSAVFLPRAFGGGYVAAGYDTNTPEQGSFTLNVRREAGGMPKLLRKPSCELVVYAVNGKCVGSADLTTQSWDEIIIHHGQRSGSKSFADGSGTDNNTELIDTQTFLSIAQYAIGRLEFTETVTAQPIVDNVYFGDSICAADCDDPQIGDERYAELLHDVFSANNPIVRYTTDGGETTSTVTLDIDALVTAATIDLTQVAAVAIDRAGSYLVVTLQLADAALAADQNAAGYILVPIAGLNSCVGGCSSDPFHVAAFGFDAVKSNQPTDIYATGRCVYWSGMNGKVYANSRLETANAAKVIHNETESDVDFTRVHGCGSTIVAVGAEDVDASTSANPVAVIYSDNNGKSWKAATNPAGWGAAGFNLTSVFVRSAKVWMVGTSDGRILRTCNAGCSWTELCQTAAQNPIDDIAFSSDQVGYFISEDANNEMIVAWTVDGSNFAKDACSTRIDQSFCDRSATAQLSANHGYRLATPQVSNYFIRNNYIVVSGRKADGSGCSWLGEPVFAGQSCPA